MSSIFSPCADCKWFIGAVDGSVGLHCAAFKDEKIPKELFLKSTREKPCSGDIRFEPED